MTKVTHFPSVLEVEGSTPVVTTFARGLLEEMNLVENVKFFNGRYGTLFKITIIGN